MSRLGTPKTDVQKIANACLLTGTGCPPFHRNLCVYHHRKQIDGKFASRTQKKIPNKKMESDRRAKMKIRPTAVVHGNRCCRCWLYVSECRVNSNCVHIRTTSLVTNVRNYTLELPLHLWSSVGAVNNDTPWCLWQQSKCQNAIGIDTSGTSKVFGSTIYCQFTYQIFRSTPTAMKIAAGNRTDHTGDTQ